MPNNDLPAGKTQKPDPKDNPVFAAIQALERISKRLNDVEDILAEMVGGSPMATEFDPARRMMAVVEKRNAFKKQLTDAGVELPAGGNGEHKEVEEILDAEVVGDTRRPDFIEAEADETQDDE